MRSKQTISLLIVLLSLVFSRWLKVAFPLTRQKYESFFDKPELFKAELEKYHAFNVRDVEIEPAVAQLK